MIYRKPCPPGTPLGPRTYTFNRPTWLRVRHPDGKEELLRVGIGEHVKVMEPVVQYCVVCTDLLKEIPLEDGSAIIGISDTDYIPA